MDVQKSAQETFNNFHKSVVLIIQRSAAAPNDIGKGSTGTGFIIGRTKRGYLVMTCAHVIRSYNSEHILRVRLPRKTKEYIAVKVHDCEEADLAIIEVKDVTEEFPILQFCDSKDIEVVAPRTVVFQLGYILPPKLEGFSPVLNLDPSVSPGTITTPLKPNGHGCQVLFYTAASETWFLRSLCDSEWPSTWSKFRK